MILYSRRQSSLTIQYYLSLTKSNLKQYKEEEKQNKTQQNTTKHNKTKQNKTKQAKSETNKKKIEIHHHVINKSTKESNI
jgi:hypothetical protein